MDPSAVKNRSAGGGARPANVSAPSIASILRPSSEDGDGDGDGPYIDLEFSIPEEDGDSASVSASGSDENELVGEKLRPEYPSDDLFFRGHSSLLFTPSSKPQLPSSILKPAAKFRVFMLRFKKSKSLHLDSPQSSPNHNKKFPVKFKLDEVPIVSLFTRENSSSRSSTRSAKLYAEESIQSPAPTSDEKKNPKDVIHKYLNKIKPLYDRASKRNSDRPRFSADPQKSAHSSGLRVVSRRLRKSRSASASVAAVRSPPRRREESVIAEEDGIQSAIAHCKRSFSSGCDLGLLRSRSDPGSERCD